MPREGCLELEWTSFWRPDTDTIASVPAKEVSDVGLYWGVNMSKCQGCHVQAMRFGNDLEACLKAIQIGFELSPRPSDTTYQAAVKTLEMVPQPLTPMLCLATPLNPAIVCHTLKLQGWHVAHRLTGNSRRTTVRVQSSVASLQCLFRTLHPSGAMLRCLLLTKAWSSFPARCCTRKQT